MKKHLPILDDIAWNVQPYWLGVEVVLDAVPLVFVQLAVCVGRVTLALEGDDDETYKDVDHEEGDDDDVDNVEDGHFGTIVQHWTVTLFVRVNAGVQDAAKTGRQMNF